jgi:prepilin-type N-terminal cleavage/methylation domain-containing protein
MLVALKIRFRTGQKARPAFTAPKLRGRSRAFTLNQREPEAFTLLPQSHGRCAFTFAKPRGQNAFTWRERSPLRSCPAVSSRRNETQAEVSNEGGFTLLKVRERINAFTLLELLIVVGIMAILMALIAPAFTTLKSAGDVTSAAYTIKGVLEQARTYAMTNNTYTWVGFAGSVGTGATVTGQVSIAVIASNDGTQLGSSSPTASPFVIGTGTGTAVQVGKLIQVQNTHIGNIVAPTNDGTEFESRPAVPGSSRISSAGNSPHSFTVGVGTPQQTTFNRWIQFSPRGEALLNGGSTNIARYAEVGVLPAHGTVLANTPNIAAIEIGGLEGSIKIYRR